jgi:hypothetical protein
MPLTCLRGILGRSFDFAFTFAMTNIQLFVTSAETCVSPSEPEVENESGIQRLQRHHTSPISPRLVRPHPWFGAPFCPNNPTRSCSTYIGLKVLLLSAFSQVKSNVSPSTSVSRPVRPKQYTTSPIHPLLETLRSATTSFPMFWMISPVFLNACTVRSSRKVRMQAMGL